MLREKNEIQSDYEKLQREYNTQLTRFEHKETLLKTHITRTEVKESMYLEQTENQMGKILQENERLQQVIKSNMLHISQLVQNHERLKKDQDSSLKEFDC